MLRARGLEEKDKDQTGSKQEEHKFTKQWKQNFVVTDLTWRAYWPVPGESKNDKGDDSPLLEPEA